MTYRDRRSVGDAHEAAVMAELARRGWECHRWAGFEEPLRNKLKRQRPYVDWRAMPDIYAAPNGSTRGAVLVDAKAAQRQDTPYHAIELNAYEAHGRMRSLGLPIIYVFCDFTCNRHEDVNFARRVTNTAGVAGSGTSFGLTPKTDQRPLNAIFGIPLLGDVSA